MGEEDSSLDLTGLGKLADSKLVNRLYEDVLAGAAKESGEILEETTKAIHLLLIPLHLLATAKDRIVAHFREALRQVPKERQVPPSPSIALPIMMSLRYMEDENPLTRLFVNLLARAMDKTRQGEAHPAFAKIIEQLSPDEALVMVLLQESRSVRVMHYSRYTGLALRPPRVVPSLDSETHPLFRAELLQFPRSLHVYLSHLQSLSLLVSYEEPTSTDDLVLPEWREYAVSDFGNLFLSACVPEGWPDEFPGLSEEPTAPPPS